MKIAIAPAYPRLVVLDGEALTVYEIVAGVPQKLRTVEAELGRHVASCDAYVAVLCGKLAPAGASVSKAKVLRFLWDGTTQMPLSVGEVDKWGLSFTADGERCVVTDWRACRVTLFDESSKKLGAAGRNIPSGASISPEGTCIVCGTADQGWGAILAFEPNQCADGAMPMRVLKPPKPSPGLDDAPYFSAWSRDGSLVAITNQSWGGRGVFVYDGATLEPMWSLVIEVDEEEAEEPEQWFPQPLAFSSNGGVLFVAQRGAIALYDARTGRSVGVVKVPNGDGSAGFAVQDDAKLLWLPGAQPQSASFASAIATAAKKPAAKKKSPARKKSAT